MICRVCVAHEAESVVQDDIPAFVRIDVRPDSFGGNQTGYALSVVEQGLFAGANRRGIPQAVSVSLLAIDPIRALGIDVVKGLTTYDFIPVTNCGSATTRNRLL